MSYEGKDNIKTTKIGPYFLWKNKTIQYVCIATEEKQKSFLVSQLFFRVVYKYWNENCVLCMIFINKNIFENHWVIMRA